MGSAVLFLRLYLALWQLYSWQGWSVVSTVTLRTGSLPHDLEVYFKANECLHLLDADSLIKPIAGAFAFLSSVCWESWLTSEPCFSLLFPTPCPFSSSAVVDPDGRIYIRNWQGGILSGGFEKTPKPIFTEGKNQLEIQNLQEDWDHFGVWTG